MKAFFGIKLLAAALVLGLTGAQASADEVNWIAADEMQELMVTTLTTDGDILPEEEDEERNGRIVCGAQNRQGENFFARGYIPANVQARALRKCERVSVECRPLGCLKR